MKTKNVLKKCLALLCAAALLLPLCACGNAGGGKDDGTYKIAVVKQMDHPSLNEIAGAITAQLDAIAQKNGVTIEYEVYSGQGEQTTLKQIGDQAIADGVDAIIPIATLAAQVMIACAEESKTPVVYAALSDPESAEVTGIDYVSGTSDALNTEYIMQMMLAQIVDVRKVGLLYSLSEVNSAKPIQEAKAFLDNAGIAYEEMTGNTNDEVIAATSTLISDGVEVVFTPTDNVVMSSALVVSEMLAEANIPYYTGADSFVRNGAFITCGVNYTDLGTRTADLAYQAITQGMEDMDDYYLMDGGIITINTETAEKLGIDHTKFAEAAAELGIDYSPFAGAQVVEVTTTEE